MTGALRAFAAALVLAFAVVGAGPGRAAPTFPPLTGRVVDDAQVLPAQVQADLTAKLAALEQKTGDQLVVVTLPTLQGYPIEDYGYQLGRAWGIGQKNNNNGVLFIIVPSERQVRIEVGYGLEPVITDALSSIILQQAVLPRFKAGDIPGGVSAGTEAIVEQLGLDPAQAQARVQAADQQAQQQVAVSGQGHAPPLVVLVLMVIFLIVFVRLLAGRGGVWALPFLFMGGGGYGGGRDDGFGGGGFSGGGGSFGGGGSSGSW
jgi:uncharacterized protein